MTDREQFVVSPRLFDHSLLSASTSVDIFDVLLSSSFILFVSSLRLFQNLSGARIIEMAWNRILFSRCWVVSLASSLVVVAVSPQKILQMSQEVQPMASLTWPSPRTSVTSQEKFDLRFSKFLLSVFKNPKTWTGEKRFKRVGHEQL